MILESVSRTWFIHNFARLDAGMSDDYDQYCIAYRCYNDKRLEIGISLCSPKDHYNKKIGRIIALGRLQAKPIKLTIDEFKKYVLDHILIKDLPNWFNIDKIEDVQKFSQFNKIFINYILTKIVSTTHLQELRHK